MTTITATRRIHDGGNDHVGPFGTRRIRRLGGGLVSDDAATATAGRSGGGDGDVDGAGAGTISILEFVPGTERHRFDISYVEQIVERGAVTRIPNAPAFVEEEVLLARPRSLGDELRGEGRLAAPGRDR